MDKVYRKTGFKCEFSRFILALNTYLSPFSKKADAKLYIFTSFLRLEEIAISISLLLAIALRSVKKRAIHKRTHKNAANIEGIVANNQKILGEKLHVVQ